jgi:hypothetical protein
MCTCAQKARFTDVWRAFSSGNFHPQGQLSRKAGTELGAEKRKQGETPCRRLCSYRLIRKGPSLGRSWGSLPFDTQSPRGALTDILPSARRTRLAPIPFPSCWAHR